MTDKLNRRDFAKFTGITGVRLIRNETNTMPKELINWQVPVTGDRDLSLCPLGDQNEMSSYENFKCYPIRLAIYEGEDGPLATAVLPDQKSMEAIDFIKAGMPGMTVGKIGKKE